MVLAAFLAAILVVPVGAVDAAPARAQVFRAGDVTAVIAPDGHEITVNLGSGSLATDAASNTLTVFDGKGRVSEVVPLGAVTADVAADQKSAVLSGAPAVRHPVSRAKDKAYADMMMKLNRNWPCAAPSVIAGGIIGFLVGFFLILGWVLATPIGLGIGAFVGYSNCGHGETIRAIQKWIGTP
ncbi:hypothetical protein [Gordonia sp. (in: high G+C Gram-positive bacteria)]|uniref:hypothetical protein n=1 Tax=Gordonia sp. (in: high G+C Gram-positive bacteria) TaxID=84139 RepID=UPI0035299426